jgi:acetyltransferase-like isoleucine patch superfamily enzyme
MIGRLKRLFDNETPAHAVKSLVTRGGLGLLSSGNARVLGWKHGHLPLGSRIIGSRHIHVEPGFEVASKVWFEAVTSHAGIQFDPSIRIGRNFHCSGQLHLSAIDRLEIGDDCLFGTNVFVADHGHGSYRGAAGTQSDPRTSPVDRELSSHGAVKIGNNCWIGDNVAVLQGVEIGAGSIIGANSVVTKNIPPNTIAVGAPAVVIRVFSSETGTWVMPNFGAVE